MPHVEIVVQRDGAAALGERARAVVAAHEGLVAAGLRDRAARHRQRADAPVVTHENLVVDRQHTGFEAEVAHAVLRVADEEFARHRERAAGVDPHRSGPIVTEGADEQVARGIERAGPLGEARDAARCRASVGEVVGSRGVVLAYEHPAAAAGAGGSRGVIQAAATPHDDVVGRCRDIRGDGGDVRRRGVDDRVLPRGDIPEAPVARGIPVGTGGPGPKVVLRVGGGESARNDHNRRQHLQPKPLASISTTHDQSLQNEK